MDIPKGIAEKEAALFARWIKTTDKNFVVDGVVDEPTFLQQECRLIFLLKEANQMGRTALPEFLRNGAPENGGHTWNPVCRWLTGDESRAFTPQERSKILRKVAVINLKKEDGGSRTNLNDIRAAVEKDKEFIKMQEKQGSDCLVKLSDGKEVLIEVKPDLSEYDQMRLARLKLYRENLEDEPAEEKSQEGKESN